MTVASNTLLSLASLLAANGLFAHQPGFELDLRSREAGQGRWVRPIHERQTWDPARTAIIVCDMWDAHHCLNAVRRVGELAPRMNALLHAARDRGATIIHAPSSCMEFYRDHPARLRAQAVPRASNLPDKIETWCHWKDATEEEVGYPIDHSDGGEDDDPEEHRRWHEQLRARGREPNSPWIRQTPVIDIEEQDYITDDGVENWSILEAGGIQNVMLVGVHTNMCVLGRPFGLRQLARHGKHVVLVRDLTDTMYNPAMPPHVSHFSGTDLVVQHIERYVCPTISSDQILGGQPFRFRRDTRPRVAMLIGEREYDTKSTLPEFARQFLYRDFHVDFIHADPEDGNLFPGIGVLPQADLLLVSVRRRAPPRDQLQLVRDFVQQGKPVVGIRTASHAFDLRGAAPPPGHALWPEFDAQVFGGNYHGHHGNKGDGGEASYAWVAEQAAGSPLVEGLPEAAWRTSSWLYKTSPLEPGTRVVLMGRVGQRRPHEPVAWTNIHAGHGRAFYTSLGHPDDFGDPAFQQLLLRGIRWSLRLPVEP
jgi:type 1 glutamine amidotransferase/nicotinamidase-related amidase